MATKRRKSRSRTSKPKNGKSELTIDRLARKTGMTARNIRAHQSRGLLALPTCAAASATTAPSTWRAWS